MHSSAVLLDHPSTGNLVVDTEQQFLAAGDSEHISVPSLCRIRVYTRGENVVAVIGKHPDNRGGDPTPWLSVIASQALSWIISTRDRWDSVTWVMHDPSVFIGANPFVLVSFHKLDTKATRLARFGQLSQSQLTRISLEHLEQLIGMQWETNA